MAIEKMNQTLVLAHCMACNSISGVFSASAGGPTAKAWKNPVGGYLAEMVRYTHDPMGSAREEIRLAKAAGIHAFGMFNAGYIVNSQFSRQTEAYWKAAQEDRAFKVYPEIWHVGNAQAIIAELQYLMKNYDDAWLRIDGKRTLFLAGDGWAGKEEMPPIVGQVLECLGGKESVYLAIMASTSVKGYGFHETGRNMLACADAVSNWWSASYGDDLAILPSMAEFAARNNKELWMRVVPSFFQLRQGAGPTIHERLGACGYYDNWMRIIKERPRVAYLVTWNDWSEDSAVMPDLNHGYAYYELTKYFTARLSKGSEPEVMDEKVLIFHHPQVTEDPVELPQSCQPTGRYNWQATPPTDFVMVVTMLKTPAMISVEQSFWGMDQMVRYDPLAKREFPAGVHFWLLHHPLASANDSAVQNVDANAPVPKFAPVYPVSEGNMVVTSLRKKLVEGSIYVGIDRPGKEPLYYRSQHAIVRFAGRPNLCTVGDVFALP